MTFDPNTTAASNPTTITPTTITPNTDPTTTMPATDTVNDTDDTYTSSYPMPPSPKAEPFIPARRVPATPNTPRDHAA
ncbi:MAG TPA: hypothetical protein VF510_11260, partial [Ktedonobacterales bacterium]